MHNLKHDINVTMNYLFSIKELLLMNARYYLAYKDLHYLHQGISLITNNLESICKFRYLKHLHQWYMRVLTRETETYSKVNIIQSPKQKNLSRNIRKEDKNSLTQFRNLLIVAAIEHQQEIIDPLTNKLFSQERAAEELLEDINFVIEILGLPKLAVETIMKTYQKYRKLQPFSEIQVAKSIRSYIRYQKIFSLTKGGRKFFFEQSLKPIDEIHNHLLPDPIANKNHLGYRVELATVVHGCKKRGTKATLESLKLLGIY